MGRKFIDKKKAQHFHLVHRSQRDPKSNDPNASEYVLLSSKRQEEYGSDEERKESEDYSEEEVDSDSDDDDMPDLVAPSKPAPSQRKGRFNAVQAKDMVDAEGMVRDGYDYSQHMKEMGEGRFYSASGHFATENELAKKVELPEDVLPSGQEQDRLLEAITLTEDLMDADLKEALTDDQAFEEIDDDFMAQAAVETGDASDEFDYDAHIAKLMAAASGHVGQDDDESDEEFDSEEEEEEEVDKTEEQRKLDELFEKTLAEEYDDDDLGELDDMDPELHDGIELEGELLDTIVEDYKQVQQQLVDDDGKVGNPYRSGNHLQEILEQCALEGVQDEDDLNEEEAPPAADPTLDSNLNEMVVRSEYLRPQEREKWDVETIVSTYSNMDNHPTVIRESRPTRRKTRSSFADSTASNQTLPPIQLSSKTGMPLGVFESKQPQKKKEKGFEVEARKKHGKESKEEKKARKEAVKAQKAKRRVEKKVRKDAYREEEQRQLAQTPADMVSTFRY